MGRVAGKVALIAGAGGGIGGAAAEALAREGAAVFCTDRDGAAENSRRSGSSARAIAVRSSSQDDTTLPRRHTSATSARSSL